MGILQDSGIVDVLKVIDDALSVIGLSNPLYEPVNEADFSPEPSMSKLDAMSGTATELGGGVATGGGGVQWSGGGREKMDQNEECVATLKEGLLDLALLLIETVIQLLDYLVDLLRLILVIIGIACTIIGVIVAAAVIASAITLGTSLLAAAASVGATLLGTIGTYAGIAAAIVVVGGLVLHFINQFVESMQEDLYAARNAGCIKGKPLNDWDPEMPGIPT
ncbi:MAG: hypothetical protein ACTH2Q_16190 [Propionibacteriaceae bacterium]